MMTEYRARTSPHDIVGRRIRRRYLRASAGLLLALTLVLLAGLGLGACTFESGSPRVTVDVYPPTEVPTTQTTAAPPSTEHSGTTVTTSVRDVAAVASPALRAAKELGPSVVNIAVSGVIRGPFGQQPYSGEGSGVIYTTDGMIITNKHVVSDEAGGAVDDIEVTFVTGERLRGWIVGVDSLTDLAVIKVDAPSVLPAATFIDSLPTVGEYAVAIGSPLGYENSVTLGVVSGLNRSIEGIAGDEGVALNNLIQTDAPISPGNSGGALGNGVGQVMGINVAYMPPGQTGAVNIGFAIPSIVATKVADEIIQTGRATHSYIGVSGQTVTTALAEQFGLTRSSGVVVAELTPGAPAMRAGIRQGDIIFKVDDIDIVVASDLLMAIRDKRPGQVVHVTLDRDGVEHTVSVTLEERPAGLN